MITYNIKNKMITVLAKELKSGMTTVDDYLVLGVDVMPVSKQTKIVYLATYFDENGEPDYTIECKTVKGDEPFIVESVRRKVKVNIEIE